MSRSRSRERNALTGADCFLRAFEIEVRRFHGASHVSQLVLRLGPGFDLEAFRALIAAVARATPILHAPIDRRFGIGAPIYRLARAAHVALPAVVVHEAPPLTTPRDCGDAGLPAVVRERLNARLAIERGELLRFDVVRYGGGAHGSDVAMTWAHLLLDGAGSELFIRRLDECARGRRPVTDLHADGSGGAAPRAGSGAAATPHRHGLVTRARDAREWQERMIGFGTAPPRSLGGPRRRVPQALAYDVFTVSRADTAIISGRAAARAGYLTPVLFYLAATMRAHDAVFAVRGEAPGHYLVPLPVNLRPKGADGDVFRTNVSLLWFHVARRHTAELEELVGELMRQRRALIRDGLIEKGAAAMDLVRAAPARLQSWFARRHLGGELASFYFAFTNEFLPGLDTFFGAEILNGFHAPAVMPSPGSSVIMSIRDGRLNVTVIYQRGAVTDAERLCLRERLLDDLLGRGADVERVRSSG
jgi:hypothetical protein